MKNSFSSKNQIKNNNNATKYTNLRIKMNRSLPCKRNQNSKQKNIKKNIRKNNTTPLMKHINEREKEKRRKERKEMDKNKIIKSHSLSNKKDKNKMQIKNKKKYENILSRSESFSIFDGKNKKNKNVKKTSDKKNINNNIYDKNENISDNKENTNNIITPINMNENICTPKNDNSNINAYNKINPVHPKVCKSPNKVNKKIYKIESLSQVGYSGPGILKYNQDNFFIYKNLNDESNVLFIGVCDGHGLVGHDVSKYLITNLPKNLNTALKKTNKYISHKETLYSTLKQVFIETNKSLCKVQSIDTKFSGSTCVTIILTKNKIISANAGDSRAVMGRYINGKWINIDLSHDQKPNNPGEKERILSHGGRIEAYKDENGGDFGPPRVWLKNEDIPGLAMSRSFGDEVAASVGTISEPEIEEYEITEDDKFIIIASDGIWEFISSQECVEFIKDFYEKKDLKGCLKFLLNESSKRWIKEEEVIDDITAVLIFFEN
jgi:serine/threonine protein phosphatase PrpC